MIHNVPIPGPALLFSVWPTAIATMRVPQVWAILFFLALVTVGIDSQIVFVHAIVTGINDEVSEQAMASFYVILVVNIMTSQKSMCCNWHSVSVLPVAIDIHTTNVQRCQLV